MSEEELDEEWDEDLETCLRAIENMDRVYPTRNWTDEDWEAYGEYLFRTYNEAHPITINSEGDGD